MFHSLSEGYGYPQIRVNELVSPFGGEFWRDLWLSVLFCITACRRSTRCYAANKIHRLWLDYLIAMDLRISPFTQFTAGTIIVLAASVIQKRTLSQRSRQNPPKRAHKFVDPNLWVTLLQFTSLSCVKSVRNANIKMYYLLKWWILSWKCSSRPSRYHKRVLSWQFLTRNRDGISDKFTGCLPTVAPKHNCEICLSLGWMSLNLHSAYVCVWTLSVCVCVNTSTK